MEPINFTSLLSSARGLNIPVYQRDYRWDVSRANDLLRDATSSLDQDLMIGLVVSVSQDSDSLGVIDIVDGQQRFTTICLILSIIEGMITDIESEADDVRFSRACAQEAMRIGDLLVKGGSPIMTGNLSGSDHWSVYGPVITPRSEFETDHPINSHASEGVSTHEARLRWLNENSGLDRRRLRGMSIYKNMLALGDGVSTYLSDLDCASPSDRFDALKKLSERFRERVTFIHYKAPSLSQAFALFETLNDRGMQVAAGDLLKNLCMKHLPVKMDEIAALWAEMFGETIEEKNCIRFFRTWHNSRHPFISTQSVYRSYEKKIRELDSSERTTWDWLTETVKPEVARFSQIYGKLNIVNAELNNPIVCLQNSSAKQWHTVALSALRTASHSSHHSVIRDLGDLLIELAKLMAVMELTDSRGSLIERYLPAVANEVDDASKLSTEEASTIIKAQIVSLIEKRKDVIDGFDLNGNLSAKAFTINTEGQFLLSLLRLKGAEQGVFFSKMTLEHVYPQKPKSGHWVDFESLNDEQKKAACYSLGNLIELSPGTNSAVSNDSFEKKLVEYRRVGVPDVVSDDNYRVLSRSKWTLDCIEKREENVRESLVGFLKN